MHCWNCFKLKKHSVIDQTRQTVHHICCFLVNCCRWILIQQAQNRRNVAQLHSAISITPREGLITSRRANKPDKIIIKPHWGTPESPVINSNQQCKILDQLKEFGNQIELKCAPATYSPQFLVQAIHHNIKDIHGRKIRVSRKVAGEGHCPSHHPSQTARCRQACISLNFPSLSLIVFIFRWNLNTYLQFIFTEIMICFK